MDIRKALEAYKGKVVIWHSHQLGSQLADRWMWTAEKDGEVIDYHRKDVLITDALAAGDQVVVLTLHRNGQVSAKEIGGVQ